MACKRRVSFKLSATTIISTGRVVSPTKQPETTTVARRPEFLSAPTIFPYRRGETSCMKEESARRYLNSEFRNQAFSCFAPRLDFFPRVLFPVFLAGLTAFFPFLIMPVFSRALISRFVACVLAPDRLAICATVRGSARSD